MSGGCLKHLGRFTAGSATLRMDRGVALPLRRRHAGESRRPAVQPKTVWAEKGGSEAGIPGGSPAQPAFGALFPASDQQVENYQAEYRVRAFGHQLGHDCPHTVATGWWHCQGA